MHQEIKIIIWEKKHLIKGIEVGKSKNNEGRQQNPNKAKTDPVKDIKIWHNNTRYFINMDANMAIEEEWNMGATFKNWDN